MLVPFFSGEGFYPIGKRVLDHWRIIFRCWHVAKLILNPTTQYCFHNSVIHVGSLAGCFGTSLEELVFKCWGSALHFEDPFKEIYVLFISDLICIFLNIYESLNIASDLKL